MRRFAVAVALAVAFAAIPAAGATAKRLEVDMQFRIPAPEGEQVTVTTDNARASIDVAIAPRDPAGALQAASYSAPAQVGARRLRAQIGRYGSIDLRFKPRGRASFFGGIAGCRTKLRKGTFRGQAAYFGEPGAGPAETSRVRGRVMTSRDACTSGFGKRAEDRQRTREVGLTASAPSDDAASFFLAAQQPGLHGTALEAQRVTRGGRLWIARFAGVRAPKATLKYDRALTTASVTAAPPPFSGTATYTRTGRRRTWTGDLSVTMLGDTVVPLTGPDFEADLYADPLGLDRPLVQPAR